MYAVVIGVPGLLMLAGASLSYKAFTFFHGARRTQGTVVLCERIHSIGANANEATSYLVTYEYADLDGTAIQAKQFSRPRVPAAIGEEHEILVNPEKTDMVRRPSISHYILGPILFAVGLAVIIAFSLALSGDI